MVLVFYKQGTFYGEEGNYLLIEISNHAFSVYDIIRQTDSETLSSYKKSRLEWADFKKEQIERGLTYKRGRNKILI